MDDRQLTRLEELLRSRSETVATAESCTGGLLAGRITDIDGSSDVFHRGFVTYCDEAKHDLLQVRWETLRQYTAVSEQTAREMAEGAARGTGAAAALSVTGYAGSVSGRRESEDGLVYIGCHYRGRTVVREYHFEGARGEVRRAAVDEALALLAACMNIDEVNG